MESKLKIFFEYSTGKSFFLFSILLNLFYLLLSLLFKQFSCWLPLQSLFRCSVFVSYGLEVLSHNFLLNPPFFFGFFFLLLKLKSLLLLLLYFLNSFLFERWKVESERSFYFFHSFSTSESIRRHFLLHQFIKQRLSAVCELQEHLEPLVWVFFLRNFIFESHDSFVNELLDPDSGRLFDLNSLDFIKLFLHLRNYLVTLSLYFLPRLENLNKLVLLDFLFRIPFILFIFLPLLLSPLVFLWIFVHFQVLYRVKQLSLLSFQSVLVIILGIWLIPL